MLGLDLLGLGSKAWNINELVAKWPQGYALGCFDAGWPDCFGDPRAKVEQILATDRCPALRTHIWWSYQHKGVTVPDLKKRLPLWEAIARKFPTKKIYISPSCEYSNSVSVPLINQWLAAIHQLAPSCIPVLTPMNAPVVNGVIVEKHGTKAKAGQGQFASTDGQNLCDIDANAWMTANHSAEITFGWGNLFNLAEAHNTLPPSKRTSAPSFKYVEQVRRNMEPKGVAPAPTFQGKITPIRKPFLYKVMAEDNPGPGTRDNRPLLIAKGNSRSAEVITKDGASLGKMVVFDRPGAYPGGLTRYYAGLPGAVNLYGWELASKALAVSGSEYVWFKVDGVIYGPTNAAFRTGFYQD